MGWGSSSDDYDDDDAGTFGADEVGGGTSSAGVGDNGDDSNEVDDSPYDTSTVGMGTNTMGGGYGGGDDQAAVAAAYNYGFRSPTPVAPRPSQNFTINGVPVERRSPVSIVNPNYVPLTRDYTQQDLAQAQRALEQAKSEAYKEKQFGFDFGPLGGPMGMYERIADALFDPTASVANAIAERGFRTYDGQAVPESAANYNRYGLDVVRAGGLLSEGGRVAAYDPRGNLVYDTSPFSGLNPFGEGVPSNIQELYNRRNQFEEEQRARNDGGDQPLIIPQEVAEVDPRTGEPTQFPTHTPRQYKYQPYVGKFYSIPSRFTRPVNLLG